ncbi:MAG: radical SAM family heme chaperone HemW [Gemmatimonadales bacterium]|nr:radical SAM family heme chaperone HemW [Gemmatimonadales bacterium]
MHLYVHVPFCARRCSYCDFAIAVRREAPSAAFAAAIEREWRSWQADRAWEGSPTLDTIYFGGGTPSRLDPEAIARLLHCFRKDRPVASAAEVTLETNPDDVTAAAADAWLAAGINRISLGVQSFEPRVLEWMHRTHTSAQIEVAVQTLRRAGFGNISLDLIYAVPAALDRDWRADLDRALALGPTHLSLYGLTVESHTPLGRWTARGESLPAEDDRAAEEYLEANRRLVAAGFEHYEVSNAGRQGFRARHNSAYWRRAPFIGLGPSAHSGLGTLRCWNTREWEEYRRRSESNVSVREASEELSELQVKLEELYLGLRTTDGLPIDRIPEPIRQRWREQGWGKEPAGQGSDARFGLTPDGWLRLDALVASLTRC